MERLLGRFNSQYETCVLALLDEVGTDKLTATQEEKLKSLVTDIIRQFEEKFEKNKLSRNHLNIFVLSNHDNAVPDRPGGRRNEYSRCSEELNCNDYKTSVIARIRTRYAAMTLGYFLQCADWLDSVKLHSKALFNDEKRRIIIRNLGSVSSFWYEKVLTPQSFPAHEFKKPDENGYQAVLMFNLAEHGFPYPTDGVDMATLMYMEAPTPKDWSYKTLRANGKINCLQLDQKLPYCRVPEAYLYQVYGKYCNDSARTSGRDLSKKDLVSFLSDLKQLVDYSYDGNDGRFIRFPCREACEAMFETYLRKGSCSDSRSETEGWIKFLRKSIGVGGGEGNEHQSCLQCQRSSRAWASFSQQLPDYYSHTAVSKDVRPQRTDEQQLFSR